MNSAYTPRAPGVPASSRAFLAAFLRRASSPPSFSSVQSPRSHARCTKKSPCAVRTKTRTRSAGNPLQQDPPDVLVRDAHGLVRSQPGQDGVGFLEHQRHGPVARGPSHLLHEEQPHCGDEEPGHELREVERTPLRREPHRERGERQPDHGIESTQHEEGYAQPLPPPGGLELES